MPAADKMGYLTFLSLLRVALRYNIQIRHILAKKVKLAGGVMSEVRIYRSISFSSNFYFTYAFGYPNLDLK